MCPTYQYYPLCINFIENLGLKPGRSTTAFGRIVPVVKVINHLKNLAVERRSAEP